MPVLHPDRLLPPEPQMLRIAREIYDQVAGLPIISPHGHTDPAWFARNESFPDPAALIVTPDHYLLRMLGSVGVNYDALGVSRRDGINVASGRDVWRCFAAQYETFAGTPSAGWIDHALAEVFGIVDDLSADTADVIYDALSEQLQSPECLPRALLDRFGVEVIATTDDATSDLAHHAAARAAGETRVIPTYRPDAVSDPTRADFADQIAELSALTGQDCTTWEGVLRAHRMRRATFRAAGATATDHGLARPLTADLSAEAAQALLTKALGPGLSAAEAALFRGQIVTEMAGMAVKDGMTLQLHAGVHRNTDPALFALRGPDTGADIPARADWVEGLAPLLHKHGAADLTMIVFTLDESTYARELAPMAGYWPSLRLGPPWWFHDSPEGIARYLHQVFETAGHRNLAGFNDDTRALLSVPGRHDTWRRSVARFLSHLVADHRLSVQSASGIAHWLCYGATKEAYKL